MAYKIPFNRPSLSGNELEYVTKAFSYGHISGDGEFTKRVHKILEESLNVKKVLLTTSCTHALEMSAILLDIKEGDEVIVPSFTFVSTINSFVLRGAVPVFVDIKSDTLNIDENLIEPLITSKTKAVLPVHYAGIGCEMDAIVEIAEKNNIMIVEDNAHGLFGKYKGKYLGTFGALATLSFHETKNFICGEGGALLINDDKYIERAEFIREKGTNRSQFFQGIVDKYTWVDVGSSYLLSDILSAILMSQLENKDEILQKRSLIFNTYYNLLLPHSEELNFRLPYVPEHCEQAYHLFYMILESETERNIIIQELRKKGILAVFHYLPLHLSPAAQKFNSRVQSCSVTEDISKRLVRLPFYNTITRDEQIEVVNNILQILRENKL